MIIFSMNLRYISHEYPMNQFNTDPASLIRQFDPNKILPVTLSAPSERHSRVGPADLWEMKRNFQINFLQATGLKPHHRMLDFGCGTLRGGIPLIQYLHKGHYTGIDIRQEVMNEALVELTTANLEHKTPQLECYRDLSELDIQHEFDIIWAFSVLIHLEDHILKDTLAFISRHLTHDGAFFANVNIADHSDGAWKEFPVVYRPLDFYMKAFTDCNFSVTDLGTLQDFGHQHPRLSKEAQDCKRMLCAVRCR